MTMLPVIVVNLVFLLTCIPGLSASGPYANLLVTEPYKSVITTLFEWRFDDIADECEQFLGPKGYAAVQVSPVMEYAEISAPWFKPEADRPWWERYQPVSYKIISRSGDEAAFSSMVDRCNKAGVRVIVDVVLNHMTGELDGVGVGGTPFKGQSGKEYPGVPYEASHFTPREKCTTEDGIIHGYDDPVQVRNCRLFGLHDLDTSQEYVRQAEIKALNRLIELGAAGFRIDSAKHILPTELEQILNGVSNLNTTYFPEESRPFIYNEIMLGGYIREREYVHLGRVQGFDFRQNLRDVLRGINNQKMAYLEVFGEGWDFVKKGDTVTMVDNHDLQRNEPEIGINFRFPKLHRIATAFMLAWPYGIPNVMSSYDWPLKLEGGKDLNEWMGPPADEQKAIKRVIRRDDGGCDDGWVCEHRWNDIANMVTWRAVADQGDGEVHDWWTNDKNQIAFGRGEAFIVINNEPNVLSETLETGLPEGIYCDMISGSGYDGECTGKTVTVDAEGNAHFEVDGNSDIPMMAIHTKPPWLPPPCPMDVEKVLGDCIKCLEGMKNRLENPTPDCSHEVFTGLDGCLDCVRQIPREHFEHEDL